MKKSYLFSKCIESPRSIEQDLNRLLEDLFYEAEKYMRDLEKKNIPLSKYNFLLKLFDKTEIIN